MPARAEFRMLRFSVVTLFLGALVMSLAAEARAGRGIGSVLRKSRAVPTQVKTVPPGDAAKAASTRGNVNVVAPVPIRRGEPRPAVNDAAASGRTRTARKRGRPGAVRAGCRAASLVRRRQ